MRPDNADKRERQWEYEVSTSYAISIHKEPAYMHMIQLLYMNKMELMKKSFKLMIDSDELLQI